MGTKRLRPGQRVRVKAIGFRRAAPPAPLRGAEGTILGLALMRLGPKDRLRAALDRRFWVKSKTGQLAVVAEDSLEPLEA